MERPLGAYLGVLFFVDIVGEALKSVLINLKKFKRANFGRFLGSKSDVNNDPDESKKTTPLTHFWAPGRPLEPPKRIFEGSGAAFNCKKKTSPKKWPQDEFSNETKIKTMAKQMKN